MARTPPCRSGVEGPDQTVGCGLENGAAWRHLDGGHTPAEEHQEPITVAGAKHAGVFRKSFDDSVDDLVLVALILEPDVELVTAHEANPHHHACHAYTPHLLWRCPNPG